MNDTHAETDSSSVARLPHIVVVNVFTDQIDADRELKMKAVAVVGPWRGGTSLVTAILRELGVFVGDRFFEACTGYDTFEDVRLRQACLACFDERPGSWCYYGTPQLRVACLSNWIRWARSRATETGAVACGGKHPVMCKLVDELYEAWSVDDFEPIVVSVIRSAESIHRSWTRPTGPAGEHWWPRSDRQFVVDDLVSSRDAALNGRRHLCVHFDRLRKAPEETIERLATDCGLPSTNLASAIATIGRRAVV